MDQKKIDQDIRILETFIDVYCTHHHQTSKNELCDQCADLLDYGKKRLAKCPYDPKPKCKDCETHCYKPAYRQRVREVMKFSGIHFVKRGRLDWAIRYFL